MKPYKMTVEVKIVEEADNDWNNVKKIDFSISEKVPDGVDPVLYLRSRLSEEVKRHSSCVDFEWKIEEQEYDDLDTGNSVPVCPTKKDF